VQSPEKKVFTLTHFNRISARLNICPDNFRLASNLPEFLSDFPKFCPNFALISPKSSQIRPDLIEPNLPEDAVASKSC